MATQFIVFNQTAQDVQVVTNQVNDMSKSPPQNYTVKAGQAYKDDIAASSTNATFTTTFDGSHSVVTNALPDNQYYFSISPPTPNDGSVGILAAPFTGYSVLQYFIGTGEMLLWINAEIQSLVGPALVDFNRNGPYPVNIQYMIKDITELDLDPADLTCSYASRKFVDGSDTKAIWQAIFNLSKLSVKATDPSNSPSTWSLQGLAVWIELAVDLSPSNLAVQVQALQVSIAEGLDQDGTPTLPPAMWASFVNSNYNADLITALNQLLKSRLSATPVKANASTDGTEAQPAAAASDQWASALARIVTQSTY